MVAIRGGVEAFLARDVDGGTIAPYTEIVVIDYSRPARARHPSQPGVLK